MNQSRLRKRFTMASNKSLQTTGVPSSTHCCYFLLAASLCSLNNLWDGGVSTSVIACYVTRLCFLLLHIYYLPPFLPLSPSKFPPRENMPLSLSANTGRFASTQDHPPTWVPPVSVPEYLSCANSTLSHKTSLPSTPSGFLSPTLPWLFQKIF